MGAWAYCQHGTCDAPINKPTAREVIDGQQYCAAGHRNGATMTRDDLLVELAERVDELEAEVKQLKGQ